jgi:hypothetical protein
MSNPAHNEKPESKVTKKTVVYQGNKYSFCLIDFSIGNHEVKNYESIEESRFSSLYDFNQLMLVPIFKGESKKKLILVSEYKPLLNKSCLTFPNFIPRETDLKQQIDKEFNELTGLQINFDIDINKIPIIYMDPSCCVRTLKSVEVEVRGDETMKKKNVYILDCDENILENINNLTETHDLLLVDKVWYYVAAMVLNHQKYEKI